MITSLYLIFLVFFRFHDFTCQIVSYPMNLTRVEFEFTNCSTLESCDSNTSTVLFEEIGLTEITGNSPDVKMSFHQVYTLNDIFYLKIFYPLTGLSINDVTQILICRLLSLYARDCDPKIGGMDVKVENFKAEFFYGH